MHRRAWALAAGFGTCVLIACGLDLTGADNGAATGPDGAAVPGADGGAGPQDGAVVLDDAGNILDAGPADDGSPCNRTRGPKMIDVGGYCIDATEITQEQYKAFVDGIDAGADAGAIDVCSWKRSYVPATRAECAWEPARRPNEPVVCVDWCDAEAYCRWAGKKLCGALDGGTLPYDGNALLDANQSAWFRACSHNGERKFPYGQTRVNKRCNTTEAGHGRAVDAGAYSECVGGYPGLFDMSGNVDEHEDNCRGTTGEQDRCKLRGGSWFFEGAMENACDHLYAGGETVRNARWSDVGFRCCSVVK